MFDFVLDVIKKPNPEQILKGHDLFRPHMKCQQAWLNYFYPGHTINTQYSTWQYLQKYVMPLIKANASSYHLNGIRLLKLDEEHSPEFDAFQALFYEVSAGFEIYPVDKEIDPIEYFALIRDKKFPCIKKLRSHAELFCAHGPDFWHEAIGHLAPLCFKEIQTFYLEIADCMLSTKTKREFENRLAIAWTLTEYGFLKQQGLHKLFGAALVGSHLANMRYLKGFAVVEAAEQKAIIQSGFYEGSPQSRDAKGRLRYFCLDDLNITRLFYI